MKRLLASLALITAVAALSGCYYDPGYGYVRGTGYNGDVYYGNAYYTAPGYYDGYYGGYYGCCYAPGVSIGYYGYGGSRYRAYRGGGYRGNGGYYHGGGYQGHGGHAQGHTSSGGAHTSGSGSHGGGSHRSSGNQSH